MRAEAKLLFILPLTVCLAGCSRNVALLQNLTHTPVHVHVIDDRNAESYTSIAPSETKEFYSKTGAPRGFWFEACNERGHCIHQEMEVKGNNVFSGSRMKVIAASASVCTSNFDASCCLVLDDGKP